MAISPHFIFSDFMQPYTEFSGDQLLSVMRVSKAWHQKILTHERKIEEPLTKLFEAVFSVLPKRSTLRSRYYINFVNKKLTHPAFQITQATSIPAIDQKVHLALLSLAKKVKESLSKVSIIKETKIRQLLLSKITNQKFPTSLVDHFKFALDFQNPASSHIFFETKRQEDKFKMSELSLFIRNRLIEHTSFSWKVKTLKEVGYNNITKAAFECVAYNLAEKGFYHSAIQLAVSYQFADKLGLPFMETIYETASSLDCMTFIGAIQDPLLKKELLQITKSK